MKDCSEAQVKHNISLQKWYPLGQIDTVWTLMDHLYESLGEKYHKDVSAVLDGLANLDDKVRADRFPLKKNKRVKR